MCITRQMRCAPGLKCLGFEKQAAKSTFALVLVALCFVVGSAFAACVHAADLVIFNC
jgi:hypothetical protein